MPDFESAWGKYPDYRIEAFPVEGTARVWLGDLLLAESDRALRLEETRHQDRLYLPREDVRWEHFEHTDHWTICPFKGKAEYWSVTATDPPEENVLWSYPDTFDEVEAIRGYVAFYDERVRVEIEQRWPGRDGDAVTVNRFPAWGDASDLLRLIDVRPDGDGRFVGEPYPTERNVVEGGHLLADAIVAASKTVPDQRVTYASMIFSKAAAFDKPVSVDVDVLRRGRSFSTVQARIEQDGQLRAAGLLLMDAGAPDLFRGQAEMPDVPGPSGAEPLDMRVTGRDLRVVDGAYSPDPDKVGPPVIHTWVRFRDAPAEPYLHTALMAQSTTHWTIAAAMLPHKGFGEADAHVTLSTGIMAVTLSVHDDVDVSQWLLYTNPAIFAGRGQAQGEGHIFTEDGRLVASYVVQAMIRPFAIDPSSKGLDHSNAM